MMTHDEMIAVIAHHRDGGVIQCESSKGSNVWLDLETRNISWNFNDNNYRAKPEPLVLWVVMHDQSGEMIGVLRSEESANITASNHQNSTIKKFIEVP
tara:strand:+ start:148 stop:441 length:294 start_codon:yes stop_codon:yes gene_type:complete